MYYKFSLKRGFAHADCITINCFSLQNKPIQFEFVGIDIIKHKEI